MADPTPFQVLVLMAALVVIEPSTRLFRTDGTNPTYKPEHNTQTVFSAEGSNSEVQPGSSGGSLSPAAFMSEEWSAESTEQDLEPDSNEFPQFTILEKDQTHSPSPAGTRSVQTVLKISPTITKTFEFDSESRNRNKFQTKHDKTMDPTNERSASQMADEAFPIKNDVESENRRLVKNETLTTHHPTLSTIALMATTRSNLHAEDMEPFTPIQKLQIESGDDHLQKALLKNAVELQEDQATSEELLEDVEDNFLHENRIPEQPELQPTQRYQASYRTTDTYSMLQNVGPEGNEVISGDIEFLHTEGVQYQKDGNTILEEPMTADNNTDDPYFVPFIQPKKILDADVEIDQSENSTDLKAQQQPSTPLTTLPPYLLGSDLLPATADIRDHVTLEAKSRTETERIVAVGKGGDKVQEPGRNATPPGNGLSNGKNPIRGSPPPGLVLSTTWKIMMTKPYDIIPGTPPPQTRETETSKVPPNGTRRNGRRGEIRVTTQRAVRRPQIPDDPTHLPSKKSTLDSPICSKPGGTCEFLGANQTLLKWEDMQRTLSFAWDMHVYGTGILFLLLSLIALINLIGSPILRVPYLPYVIVANTLLFGIGILRGVFFLFDPYGTKMKISQPIALVLYNVTFPLMLSTFATLVLLILKIARLQLLPSKFQSLALLGVIAVIHFIVLLSADLLSHMLNPSVNMVLQILSISWGIFLMVGNFVAYYRLRKSSKDIVNETQRVSPSGEDIVAVQTQGTSIKCMFTSSRVLLVCSVFGLLCCGLQVYAILWLYGLLGKKEEFSWSWWFLQFWFRIFELALCFSMLFVASHGFCLQCTSSDHTCWSKIISYFCTYKKTEVPEYPNNCYDWSNNIQERMVNNNIDKNLIRNQAENVPLRIIKENNENKSGPGFSNDSRSSSPLFRPKPDHVVGPKSQNVTMGRSYTSICFEKESMLSLTDLEFRPPSPINLSRSIDEALFREHLVRDSIFLDSSLQYPSYLTRQDSCSSLKECSALNQTVDPLISSDLKMRRLSNPDYLYSLAKGGSMTEIDTPSESLEQGKEIPHDITTEAVASGSSMDSVSKGSIKISWNPWRHGLSSVESLPLEETPNTQLLNQGSQPSIVSKASEHEKSFGRRLIERSQTTDSHSIASETIEL